MHKPSHASYYDLTIEQLAQTRMWLLEVFKAEGMQCFKKIYRKQKKNEEFKQAWAIVKAMHGIHESGLAFQNAVKKTMESRCNMIESKVNPAIWFTRELYTRVQFREDDVPEEFGGTVAKEFVILTISTD